MFFQGIIAGLFFLLNPPPSQPAPPANSSFATPEEAVEYETRFQGCAGTDNPDQCRADLGREYGLS